MGLFKLKNPYPKMGITATSRKGKVNPNSEGNTDLKDGKSKSSTFQRYMEPQEYKVFNMGNKPSAVRDYGKNKY